MATDPADGPPRSDPVTVTVARRIAPGREEDFVAFSRRALATAADWPGFLGGGILRPPPGGDEYHVVYRFVDADAQRAWEESDQRASLMEDGDELMETIGVWRIRGLHDWFDLPGRGADGPPKWKLAVVACAAVIPMSLAMTWWIVPALDVLPVVPRTVVTSVIFAAYMTFLAVPWISGLVRRWLYPRD
ncbi:antibiotic biosynthesis monooxygenase [Salsipaludibacter albus]|uniref:antibiotic biosynthesis monooxygenase n=1 Tax=Salsipaludibacter albus TaxID=2849650 RepID=UPI001EE4487A|nr:antibiotic biosynthesis monooxygenase [Salsipaludibacter albus]